MMDYSEYFVVDYNAGEPVRIRYYDDEETAVDFIKCPNDILLQPSNENSIVGYRFEVNGEMFYVEKGELALELVEDFFKDLPNHNFSFRNLYRTFN